MRSNDAWLGLPHDIFCFTMIQELVARSLGFELGDYKHFAGSLHLYADDVEKAARFQSEGLPRKVPMPPMPKGDPWLGVKALLAFERKARRSATGLNDPRESMDPYWADLATLLAIHASGKAGMTGDGIQRLKRRLSSDVYAIYINRRFGRAVTERSQLTLMDTKGFIHKNGN
jgi:thymidylate synthase